jgi:hypothetical protein
LRHQLANQVKIRLRFISHLNHLVPGQPPLLAVRSPETTGLASSLIDCFFSQPGGAVFNIAGLSEVYSRGLPTIVSFPLRVLFLSASRRLSFGEPNFYSGSGQNTRTVLIRSSNQSLFGNCDSFKLETCLNYLTRPGTVSHRPSPPVSHSHLARANAPENPVNFASAANLSARFRGAGPTNLTRLFPGHPGLS